MEFIIKKIEKNFFVAQVIAAPLGLSAIGLWMFRPDLLLLAEALGCFTVAYLLTVRLYYNNKLDALAQAEETLQRTGAATVPVFSGYTCYGRLFEAWNGNVHFIEEIGKW